MVKDGHVGVGRGTWNLRLQGATGSSVHIKHIKAMEHKFVFVLVDGMPLHQGQKSRQNHKEEHKLVAMEGYP